MPDLTPTNPPVKTYTETALLYAALHGQWDEASRLASTMTPTQAADLTLLLGQILNTLRQAIAARHKEATGE